MKNAISRFGYTCAATALFCAVAGVMSAETMNRITVNLPEDTVVGSSILAAGTYTITDLETAGAHVFIFRGESGKPVMLQAETIEQASEPAKSSRLVLSKKGSEVRLDKLLIEGSSLGYEFEPGRPNDSRDQK